MFPAGYHKARWAIAAALIAAPIVVGAAFYAAINSTAPESDLQQVADDAALAGVNALAASIGQPPQKRIDAAVAAASAAVAQSGHEVRKVEASPEQMTSSVTLAEPDGSDVTSTARYIAPSDGSSAQASAGLGADLTRSRM
jgi:hypothetical protein